jgi:uncharacterized membrane protein YgdD (TMEM256/DUF423 family)
VSSTARWVLALGGLLVALATITGAFGAHALQSRLAPDRLAIYETAVRYHFYHALGLLAVGVAAQWIDSSLLRWAAILIVTGIVFFSGSIYGLSFGGPRILGPITPLGGTLLIVGWCLFAAAIWRAR